MGYLEDPRSRADPRTIQNHHMGNRRHHSGPDLCSDRGAVPLYQRPHQMRIFVEVSSPGVERELKTMNHTLTAILDVLKAEPPDFSSEDAAVLAATQQVSEAKDRIPHEQ